MKKTLVLLSLALGACNFSPAPTEPNPQAPLPDAQRSVLGTLEVGIDTRAKTSSLSFRAGNFSGRAATPKPNSAISLVSTKSVSVITDGSSRYINATFQIKNVGTEAFSNLTLYAYSKQSDGAIGGTALKLINAFGGVGTDAVAAQKALPTHGTLSSGGFVSIDPNGADFQAFAPADSLNVQNSARSSSIIAPIDTVLDYGFTAKACANVDCSSITPEGRNIAVNGEGRFTLGLKVPSTGTPNDDFRFSMTFVVADETDKKVTRGVYPLEDLNAAQARAAAIGATLVQVGAGQPIVNPVIATTPAFLLEPQCASGTPAVTNTIMTVQGSTPSSDAASSLINIPQTLEGVVTANFNTSSGFNGFYIQDRFGDGNTNTSDGIFVYNKGVNTINVGDFVRVSGTVLEGFAQTQLGRAAITGGSPQPESLTSVVGCSTRALPAPVQVSIPLTNGQADLEKFEGMRIRVNDTLAVTEHFNLDQFGEVLLSSAASDDSNQDGTDIRLEQFTQFNVPNIANNAAHLLKLAKRRLLVDDGSSVQNPPTNLYGRGGTPLTAANTLRGGDTVTGIEGVLGFGFSAYRLQPTAQVNFQAINLRPTLPVAKTSGNLRVASFNVLNYFTTLNDSTTASFAKPAPCTGTIGPRGANTQAEFDRQKLKTVAAIKGINADVLGVIEMQNNGSGVGSAVQDLVDALNAGQPTADLYAIAPAPLNGFGCDAIKVDFIYKSASARITPGTSPASIALASNPGFNETGRTPVAVTFEQLDTSGLGTGKVFTAVMNHFKSKGSSSAGLGNTDTGDGQGRSNGTRSRSANELAAWLTTKPTGTNDTDIVLLGDFNAYSNENPLTILKDAGYPMLIPNTEYSYVFNGQWGSLDHALGNISASQITRAGKLHINADEPDALDYNIQLDPDDNSIVVKTPAQVSSLYAPDAFRSSDHDAVYVDLNLSGAAVGAAPTIAAASSTTARLNAPSSGPASVSGVISDPTDPASLSGINFTVADSDTAFSGLTVTASLSNASVVSNANLVLSGTDGSRNLKITPTGVGFSTITVTVNDGSSSASYVIQYASSAAGLSTSRFFTGKSDASTAQDVGDGFMLVADDEDQRLRLYDRANSGLPTASFDFTSSLGLTDLSGGNPREVDIEASARVGNRIYWMGSLSNNSGGDSRPNRNRIFATDLSGTGSSASLSFVGYYAFLRDDLVAWDVSNGNPLGLSASTATGKSGEAVDGLNLEGLSMAPGSTTTALLGFRTPLEDTVNRNRALVVPVTNFTALPSLSGGTAGSATFGTAILLDLGGRGIREIKCSVNAGEGCFILAGPFGTGTNFALYSWSGNAGDAAQFRQDLSSLATASGGSLESIVALPTGNLTSSAVDGSSLQLLSDNGDTVYYGGTTIAKDLAQNNFKKFRSDTVTVSSAVVTCTVNSVTVTPSSASVNVGATTPLTATVNSTPVNCAPNTVNWSSSDDTKASVSSGVVSGVAATTGTPVSITATSTVDPLKFGSSSVTVNAAVATGKVVVSQVYGGGGNTGAQFSRDFVELKNVGAAAVSLNGWTLQYQSSAGPAWNTISSLPNVQLQPGQYFLVHSGSTPGANGVALPTADATVTNTSGLSSTNAKLALVSNSTALTCSSNATCFPNSAIVDLVGYGTNTAAVFEGSGSVATLSNTTAAIRNNSGCTDTNNNSSDFVTGAPNPRNSSTTLAACTP